MALRASVVHGHTCALTELLRPRLVSHAPPGQRLARLLLAGFDATLHDCSSDGFEIRLSSSSGDDASAVEQEVANLLVDKPEMAQLRLKLLHTQKQQRVAAVQLERLIESHRKVKAEEMIVKEGYVAQLANERSLLIAEVHRLGNELKWLQLRFLKLKHLKLRFLTSP